MKHLRRLLDRLLTYLYPSIPDTSTVPSTVPQPQTLPVAEAPHGDPVERHETLALTQLTLAYEAQPFRITQAWGVPYGLFGIKRHHGIDIAHGHNARIRAPFDFSVYRTLWQPNGGGRVLSIVSRRPYPSPFGMAFVLVDYMHLDKMLMTDGNGSAGQLIAIAGNTGHTTGPHTHIKHQWVRYSGSELVPLDKNDAANSFDPMPYYDGTYAVDLKA